MTSWPPLILSHRHRFCSGAHVQWHLGRLWCYQSQNTGRQTADWVWHYSYSIELDFFPGDPSVSASEVHHHQPYQWTLDHARVSPGAYLVCVIGQLTNNFDIGYNKYADDTQLYIALLASPQRVLIQFEMFSSDLQPLFWRNGLLLNPDKSEVAFFEWNKNFNVCTASVQCA